MKIPKQYTEIKKKSLDLVGLMPLSLGKLLFYKKSVMKQYAKFMNEHFLESYFLIADLPKRHNLIAINNLNEKEALKNLIKEETEFRVFLEKITKQYQNIKILNWKQASNKFYDNNLNILKKYYKDDLRFRKDCNDYVLNFLNLPQNKSKIETRRSNLEKALKNAHNYLLEELAMLLSFPVSLRKRVCEIYPGKINVQESLQNGKYEFNSKLVYDKNRLFMEVYNE